MSMITDFLVSNRMPPPETKALHTELMLAVMLQAPASTVDALLAKCETDECAVCGSIICPHGEPLHFHHDGCPACDSGEHDRE